VLTFTSYTICLLLTGIPTLFSLVLDILFVPTEEISLGPPTFLHSHLPGLSLWMPPLLFLLYLHTSPSGFFLHCTTRASGGTHVPAIPINHLGPNLSGCILPTFTNTLQGPHHNMGLLLRTSLYCHCCSRTTALLLYHATFPHHYCTGGGLLLPPGKTGDTCILEGYSMPTYLPSFCRACS